MSNKSTPERRRSDTAFMIAIVLGLIVGILVKRVRLGMILGLVIGSTIVFLGWIKMTRK